jgi:hypothetical protein
MYDYVYMCTWSMVLHKYSRPRHVYWSCCARKFSKCPFCVDIEGTWRRWWRKLTGSIITSCHMSLLTADLVTRLFSTGYSSIHTTHSHIQLFNTIAYSVIPLYGSSPLSPLPPPSHPSPLLLSAGITRSSLWISLSYNPLREAKEMHNF